MWMISFGKGIFMRRLFGWGVGIVWLCFMASPAFSVEVAPRLTDREIITSLAELRQGQKGLDQRFDAVGQQFEGVGQRFEDVNQRFEDVNQRFEGVDQRFDDVNRRMDDLRADMNTRFAEMRQDMNTRFAEMRQDMNMRFGDVNQRLDASHRTMLAFFGTLVTLIVTLFGYIAWDRRTLVKPLQDKLMTLEQQQLRDAQTLQESGSRLQNLLDALRKLAREDEKLASVLRAFSLL